jgi:hypothetical protein
MDSSHSKNEESSCAIVDERKLARQIWVWYQWQKGG